MSYFILLDWTYAKLCEKIIQPRNELWMAQKKPFCYQIISYPGAGDVRG